jgi:hypothetical protein
MVLYGGLSNLLRGGAVGQICVRAYSDSKRKLKQPEMWMRVFLYSFARQSAWTELAGHQGGVGDGRSNKPLPLNVPAIALAFRHFGLRLTPTICRQRTADRNLLLELPLLIPPRITSVALVWLNHRSLAGFGCCFPWHTNLSDKVTSSGCIGFMKAAISNT